MLLLGSSGTGSHGEGAAGAVDLDGTNDYFSRASDFTGNADGKTFTFSAWVWNTSSAEGDFYKSSSRFRIDITNSNLRITGQDSGANPILIYTSANFKSQVEIGTFYHVLMSIDLTNASNRHVYINDVAITGGSFGTYTNANIDFTNTAHGIGENFKGRLSHLYLDYTYRDLSNVTNRRLFITADRKPAQGQAALNPILYLPMDDPTTAHINQGTGGNFTLNGVVARSGRGPNQYNAAYSDLDGSADYLSSTAIAGIADGKQFTFAFSFNKDSTGAANNYVAYFGNVGGADRFIVRVVNDFQMFVEAYNASGTLIFRVSCYLNGLGYWRNHYVVLSVDLANAANRQIKVNGGSDYSYMSWDTYTNDTIDWLPSSSPVACFGASATPGNYFNGRLGNLYFNTTYIDLSQPSNLAKFVTGTGIDAKPVDLGANGELPTGTAPLIYLPMYGNNAGKNYGTGGDFTVNSGPYPGARGPNEFWGNKAGFDGTTGYLARTSALAGVSDGKTFSCSFFVKPTTASGQYEVYCLSNIATSSQAYIYLDNGKVRAYVYAAGTGVILNLTGSTTMAAGSTYSVSMCIDLANTSNRSLYVNGVAETVTYSTYSNVTIPYTACIRNSIGVMWSGAAFSDYLSGDTLSEFYFTTEYIDFSQEANRLKFRDAFGSPVALLPQIEAGAIPAPAIYLRFDPADQGRNDGTGGNFTKSGTITDGGQL